MSKLPRRRFGRKPRAKRFDRTNMIKALEDMGFVRGTFDCLGVVSEAEDGGDHFELDGEDLLVEVTLQPTQQKITARVGTVAGGAGVGIWRIPPVGTEVKVSVPDGDLSFQPVISCWYSSGTMPPGVTETDLLVVAPTGGKIFLTDGAGGGTRRLVAKEAYEVHTHPTAFGLSGPPDNATAPTSYTDTTEAK